VFQNVEARMIDRLPCSVGTMIAESTLPTSVTKNAARRRRFVIVRVESNYEFPPSSPPPVFGASDEDEEPLSLLKRGAPPS
jgi:hypothetical protein